MRATIEVDMDNAAFNDADGGSGELARILRKLADGLESRHYTPTDGGRGEVWPVTDYNGNRVGTMKFTE